MSSNICPECKSILVYQEGCRFCLNCGYADCDNLPDNVIIELDEKDK